MKRENIQISKFLSLVLRHKPETIDLQLDENGWANIDSLITAMNKAGLNIDIDEIKNIVSSSDKQRFSFNDDFSKIRANQGHSIEVELNLEKKLPPNFLYHGTSIRNLDSIRKKGILKQKRHHVHLSNDSEIARKVGMRYGKPIVLKIDSGKMSNEGISFYISDNKVWLTEYIDVKYIKFEE